MTHRGPWHLSKFSFVLIQGAEGFQGDPVYTWFRGIGSFFPELLYGPSTQKTGVTQYSDDLNRRVRPYLMWNVELKTLDYFRCVLLHDLRYLSSFPKLTWCPNALKKVKCDPLIAFICGLNLIGCEMWYWKLCIAFCEFLFHVVLKILFSFRICMNVANWARFLSYAIYI